VPLPAQHALRRYHHVHEQWTRKPPQPNASPTGTHGTALLESDGGGTV